MKDFKMKINGEDIKVSVHDEKNTLEYFVCTCKEEDRDYWKKDLEQYISFNEVQGHVTTAMTMDLWHTYDVEINNIFCDMWMGIHLSHRSYNFYIQTDVIEYGLLCAIRICEYIESLKIFDGE